MTGAFEKTSASLWAYLPAYPRILFVALTPPLAPSHTSDKEKWKYLIRKPVFNSFNSNPIYVSIDKHSMSLTGFTSPLAFVQS